LAERYDRLEMLVGRLAELSRSTQPRRAALLQQLVAESRNQDVAGQFDKVIALLEKESYSSAISGQNQLEGELQKLLELLLQEDRDRQIESERKKIGRYLQDLNKIIRLQRGVKARTDGGDEAKELSQDQHKVGEKTDALGKEIEENERQAKSKPDSDSKGEPGSDSAKDGEQKDGDSKSNNDDKEPAKGNDGEKPQQGEPSKSDNKPREQPKGSQSKPSNGKPSDTGEQGKQADSPQQGEQKNGQPSESSPSQGEPSNSPGESGENQQNPQGEQNKQSPMDRAAERLRQAQERMKQAEKQLEESKRKGAVEEQEKAVQELEQAKAELERILRQLREEELERMLVMLEARFRKMLDEQTQVYDETKKLEAAAGKAPAHEVEIATGRLSRKEGLIVREADRALVLLHEDGTSVAFPEAIEQARDDMQTISDRLRDVKVDMITQGLEEDVIAALEETLAAMQQALKDLREQKGQQQQGGGSGQPGEEPLVDRIAELRMIRSLQARVNNRTKQYGAMIEGEQALQADLIKGLEQLALRQQKIFQATHDLGTKEQ
jgi:hypothetical protein